MVLVRITIQNKKITKRFGEKLYTAVYSADNKREANDQAAKFRKHGIPSRVFKEQTSRGGWYLVFARGRWDE
jgi:hypothetical protein